MFADKPTDDELQAQRGQHQNGDEIDAIEMWLEALAAGAEDIKPHRHTTDSRLTPTEIAEMAYATAQEAPHKSNLIISPFGHALVTVGYPVETNIAQHKTHLGLQHDYNMVLTKTETIENPEGYHDYEVAHYLHRDHYDEAVLRDLVHHYR